MADAIINDDIVDATGEEETPVQHEFVWESLDNCVGHQEIFCHDFVPRNGAKLLKASLKEHF